MKLVEVRDLDGPNIFLLKPAIKVEFQFDEEADERAAIAGLAPLAGDGFDDVGAAWLEAVERLHDRAGLESPDVVVTPLEEAGHIALAFGWTNRRIGRLVAGTVAKLTLGEEVDLDAVIDGLTAIAASDDRDDRPELITDAERHVPAVGITGTNGKTTTTRLLAHIVQTAGKVPGWCSTSGVFIDGEPVLQGDYTGPSGARRVLLDERVDVALLETARGGILLRGLGYESNDVSVFTNISPDHLGMLGVWTVEGLVRVKTTVIAVTRPDGAVVLNADDPLVWELRSVAPARVIAVSRTPTRPEVVEHLAAGGAAVLCDDGVIVLRDGSGETPIAPVSEIPLTWGGRAGHMVENALCATAAALALGFPAATVAAGLRTFSSSADSNPGRLNAYRLDGKLILIDFAHNEAGLDHLLNLARELTGAGGKVRAIVGSAGDRTDDSIRAMCRMAGERADAVYLRETNRYLRGRESNDVLIRLYFEGLALAGAEPAGVYPIELDAVQAAVADSSTGDVIASMAYEQAAETREWLLSLGAVAVS